MQFRKISNKKQLAYKKQNYMSFIFKNFKNKGALPVIENELLQK